MSDKHPAQFAAGGFVMAGASDPDKVPAILTTPEHYAHKDDPRLKVRNSHFDKDGNWVVVPYPPNSRVFADFTGASQVSEDRRTYSVTEMARMRAEAEEAGERYADVAPNAGIVINVANDDDAAVQRLVRTLDENRDFIRRHIYGLDEVDVPEPDNDNLPPAIGLSGFAQSGKTAVANYIEKHYGYRRQHIAEPLRDMLRTLLRRFGMGDDLIDDYLTGPLKEEVIPELGITSRQAQITLGTEWGRELVHNDLWANLWAHEADEAGGRAMNDSVRFPNEERAIQEDLGGFTIMIVRPGTGPVAFKNKLGKFLYHAFGIMSGVHPSERTDLLNPTYTIENTGTLEDLYASIDDIMSCVL